MTQKKFERILYIVVGLAVLLRLTGAYLDQKDRQTLLDARPAPEFEWRDFNSDKHQFSDLKGKVVVLHFWASWCGPCRVEFPSLLQAADKLKDDAVFLTISGDEDDSPARKFLLAAKDAAKVKPDNVLYGFDPMKKLSFDVFQSSAFPETIIVDPQQRMQRKFKGMMEWDNPNLIDYIRSLKHQPTSSATAASANHSTVPAPQ